MCEFFFRETSLQGRGRMLASRLAMRERSQPPNDMPCCSPLPEGEEKGEGKEDVRKIRDLPFAKTHVRIGFQPS